MVFLRNVVASNNIIGLESGDRGIVSVAHSVVTENDFGLRRSVGGTLNSYGDNNIGGNTTADNTGALTPLAMH